MTPVVAGLWLLISWQSSYAGHMTAVEFSSAERCAMAIASIKAVSTYVNHMVCVPK